MTSFLRTLLYVFIFSSLSLPVYSQTSNSSNEITILHTNDLHTHFAGTDEKGNACNKEENCQGGYGQIAKLMEEIKAEKPNVLVLDAGDRLQGSLSYSMKKWKGATEFENFLPFDVVTLGNHEYDEGCEELSKYINASNRKVVAANIKFSQNGFLNQENIASYEIKQFGKIKVGIVGLASDKLSNSTPSCANLIFEDPDKSAQEAINQLKKQGADLIIILSHLGIEKDIQLGQTLIGADIIVGGHSHKYIGEGSYIGPYPIVLTSPAGKPVLMVTTNGLARYLGELNVKLDEKGKLLSWNGRPIRLGKAGGQKEISNLVNENNKEIQKMLNSSVFINEVNVPDGFDACRHGYCLAASLMVETMLENTKSQGGEIALINGGTVRNGIPIGNVTKGDLIAAYPFGDEVVIKQMKGSEIIEALRQGISDVDGIGPRMLHAAGLRYIHNPEATFNKRLIKVEIKQPNGQFAPINPNKEYLVATTKFLSNGGDDHVAIKESKTISEPGLKVIDLINKRFEKDKILSNSPAQDIYIVD